MTRNFNNLVWSEINWQRPFGFQTVQELLTHLAGTQPRGPIVWEVRGSGGKVQYLIGTEKQYAKKIKDVFQAHGNIQFSDIQNTKRKEIGSVKSLHISQPVLSLKTDNASAVMRAVLAVMTLATTSEEIVLQIILGPSFSPVPLPNKLPDPHASWLDIILGNVSPASSESRNSMKEKSTYHGFSCTVRIGAVSGNTTIADSHIRNLLSALRVLESAGVKINVTNEKPLHLNQAYVPWHFPLRLSVKELASLFLLPVGEEELPGVKGLHPKLLLPPDWLGNADKNSECCFGVSLAAKGENDQIRLSVSPRDSLEHTVILGPTGSGKSNAMLSMILASINAGRSILVIDPKADLVNDILSRIPEDRIDDVVVIDPSDPCPVGVNPFTLKNQNPELIADSILAVFKDIFADSWGIRSQDILSGALLTLAKTEESSLVLLPALLTNDNFRRKITGKIDDKIGLEPFWAGYEAMSKAERAQVIAPVLNKLRQFLLRPGLRNVLGQTDSKFSLTDLFYKRKIVLVPLNKGIIGSESARLLGSLIVGLTWTLALNRAKISPEKRHVVNIFIDELQDYLSLPTDLADALAQARGLGLGLVLAHQYRSQLSPAIRAGIDANARNKIVFGLNSGDAKDMAAMAPGLEPIDFMLMPRYQIYTSLQVAGKSTGWISGQTLPPIPAFRSAAEVKAKSMERYGQDINEINSEYLRVLEYSPDSKTQPKEVANEVIGRKKREQV